MRSAGRSCGDRSNQGGGGFGDPETNRRIEREAVGFVRSSFKRRGWLIKDRQHDCCGFDLVVTRGRNELHLEVKGTDASIPGFIISRNELNCSVEDKKFRLCVVTNALNRQISISLFTATEMRKAFALSPTSYIGRLKRVPR